MDRCAPLSQGAAILDEQQRGDKPEDVLGFLFHYNYAPKVPESWILNYWSLAAIPRD